MPSIRTLAAAVIAGLAAAQSSAQTEGGREFEARPMAVWQLANDAHRWGQISVDESTATQPVTVTASERRVIVDGLVFDETEFTLFDVNATFVPRSDDWVRTFPFGSGLLDPIGADVAARPSTLTNTLLAAPYTRVGFPAFNYDAMRYAVVSENDLFVIETMNFGDPDHGRGEGQIYTMVVFWYLVPPAGGQTLEEVTADGAADMGFDERDVAEPGADEGGPTDDEGGLVFTEEDVAGDRERAPDDEGGLEFTEEDVAGDEQADIEFDEEDARIAEVRDAMIEMEAEELEGCHGGGACPEGMTSESVREFVEDAEPADWDAFLYDWAAERLGDGG